MGFDLVLYHMRRFEKKRGVKYVGGEIHVVKCIDPDRWSYFKALGIVKEFKYGGEVRLWWKGSSESLYNNLRLLNDDREALNLAKYADDNEEEVELYVEHLPSMPEIIKCIEGVGEEGGQEQVVQPEVVKEVVADKVVMGEEEEVREQEVMEEVREEEVGGEEVREEKVRGHELRGEEVREEEVLLDKFLDVGNMTVNQIIDEVRKNYSVGVTLWRAARAKEIAMDYMVGDG